MEFFRAPIEITLSSLEDIRNVYEQDIYSQSRLVESKFGKAPFYENFEGFSFEDLYSVVRAEKIICSEYAPRQNKWSKKYGKTIGD